MFMMEKPDAATAGGLECIGGVVRLIALVECLSIDHDRYIVLECNDWGNVTCIEPKLDTCALIEANIWCPKSIASTSEATISASSSGSK